MQTQEHPNTVQLLKNFRANLGKCLKDSERSKTAIAEEAHIHRVTLHKIIAGDFEPSLEMCEKIAVALGFQPPEKIFEKSR